MAKGCYPNEHMLRHIDSMGRSLVGSLCVLVFSSSGSLIYLRGIRVVVVHIISSSMAAP